MFFISFLLAFFVFLLAISLINLFLSFAIKLVTNNHLDEYKFIIPSLLYLIINTITFVIIYLADINILGLSIRDSVMAIIFKTIDLSDKLQTILVLDLIIVAISIIIQSICLMTVNIDYTVMTGKIRMIFKDLIKKIKSTKKDKNQSEKTEEIKEEISTEKLENTDNIVNDTAENTEKINIEVENEEKINNEDVSNLAAVIPEGEMAENKKRLKLNFGNAIICTIFIFSFMFFMLTALFTIGSILSSKIL